MSDDTDSPPEREMKVWAVVTVSLTGYGAQANVCYLKLDFCEKPFGEEGECLKNLTKSTCSQRLSFG